MHAFTQSRWPTPQIRYFNHFGNPLRSVSPYILLYNWLTESVNRLSLADHIIVFDSNGHVSEQGTFEKLRSSENRLLTRLSNTKDESSTVAPASAMPQTALDITPVNSDTRRQEGDWSVYWFYGASMGWLRLALYGTCILCSGTFGGLQSKSASASL